VSRADPQPLPLPQRVFQRLDDGSFLSGETLAAELSVTRAAIWKAVEQLRDIGVRLDAQTHKGYRLAPGVSALAPAKISSLLPAETKARIEALLVEWEIESTNTRLLEALPPRAGFAAAVLAEQQTGGRGRRGRGWVAPPGGAICLSVAWQFPDMPADLSALSLAVGVAVADALDELGLGDVRLKWPNDLVTARGKLGGILIEMRAESGGPVHVVVGIGINVLLDESARAAVAATGNQADDLRAQRGAVPDRNVIVASVLRRLVALLVDFPRKGLITQIDRWSRRDALEGREIRVESSGELTRGVARGIDAHGALLVETPDGVQRFISGEVSVRADS